ncbi:uncharacterized protein METZ01_LOCUS142020, partial [marine metagenome]
MAQNVLITPASTKVAFTDAGDVTTVLRTSSGRFEFKDSGESSFVDLYANDIVLDGNLTVGGTTTTVNTSSVLIEDPILQLAKGQTSGSPTVDIGFLGLRGSSNNAAFIWDESDDVFAAILTTSDGSGTTLTPASYAGFKAGNTILSSGAGTVPLIANQTATGAGWETLFEGKRDGAVDYRVSSNSDMVIVYNPNITSSAHMWFSVNGAYRLALMADGKVGIGTSAPDSNLHIWKATAGSVTASSDAQLVVENSAIAAINLLSGSSSHGQILFGDAADNDDGQFGYDQANREFYWKTAGNNTKRMLIDADGNVGIGTTAPTATLHVRDTSTSSGRWTAAFVADNANIAITAQAHDHVLIQSNDVPSLK